MRKKALLAIGAAGIMALGVSAGTFALFSDQAAATGTLTAGTLHLSSNRDQGDSVPGPMFYTTAAEGATPSGLPGFYPTGHWAPGDSRLRVLIVNNTGSLAAWLNTLGATMDPSTSMHLANELRYCIATNPVLPPNPDRNSQQPMCPDAPAGPYIAAGILGDLINATTPATPTPVSFTSPISMNAGGIQRLYFYVSLPLDADNSYQGETLKVNFSVGAVQQRNNP